MNSESRTLVKPVFIFLFFACIVGLNAGEAFAQQAQEDSLVGQTRPRRVESLTGIESRSDYSPAPGSAGAIVIAYAAYAEAFSPEPVAASRAFSLPSAAPAKAMTPAPSAPNWTPFPVPTPAASTAPMSVGEKFSTVFKGRFLSPGAYIGAIAKGAWGEFKDNDDFKEDTFGNYVADSGTRAARSWISSTTYAFYEKAILPSIFKQDPRYHRSTKTGAGAKLLHAATRIVVTQGDTCGCDQFNVSFMLGGALGAVTANTWERSERTGPVHTTQRYLWHIGFKIIGNIMREFLGGQ